MKTIQTFLLAVALMAGCYSASAQQATPSKSAGIVEKEASEVTRTEVRSTETNNGPLLKQQANESGVRHSGQTSTGKYIVDEKALETMPKEKRDYVLANPNQYEIRKSNSK